MYAYIYIYVCIYITICVLYIYRERDLPDRLLNIRLCLLIPCNPRRLRLSNLRFQRPREARLHLAHLAPFPLKCRARRVFRGAACFQLRAHLRYST